MAMTSDQWYSFMKHKPYSEQARIFEHWQDEGQYPVTSGEKKWYNEMKNKTHKHERHEGGSRKHKRKKSSSRRRSSGLRNFLGEFGDWSMNVQEHFNRTYGGGGGTEYF